MTIDVNGHEFRAAEGRLSTIDLGRALGYMHPTNVNDLLPDDEIQTVMRLRAVTPETAATAAQEQGEEGLAQALDDLELSGNANDNGGPPAEKGPEVISRVFEENEIRIARIDGEPWIVASDICDALGLDNTSEAVRRLRADERTLTQIEVQSGAVQGHFREMNVVNEPGAYRLIFTSQKAEARRFKTWLAHDVLPEIRETGGYNKEDAQPEVHVHPEIEVTPDLHVDTESLAEEIAKGIADGLPSSSNGQRQGWSHLPGRGMSPSDLTGKIWALIEPFMDNNYDYEGPGGAKNPYGDMYNYALREYGVNVRSYHSKLHERPDTDYNYHDNSKIDAAYRMHQHGNYPPVLRILLERAKQIADEQQAS